MSDLLQNYGEYKSKRFPELEKKSSYFLKKKLVESSQNANNNTLKDMIDHFIAIGILVDRGEMDYPVDLLRTISEFADDVNYNRF
jgi:hypothetical protein